MFFTDEAQVTRDYIINFENSHVSAEQNPLATKQAYSQNRFTFNVWCGVHNNRLIDSYLHITPLATVENKLKNNQKMIKKNQKLV